MNDRQEQIDQLTTDIKEIEECLEPIVMEPGIANPMSDRIQNALKSLLESKKLQLKTLDDSLG